jgi:hypothetical protein
MSGQDAGVGVSGQEAGYLIALKAELSGRGLESAIDVSGYSTRLRLDSPTVQVAPFDQNVVAAPCCDGTWWYWFPWAERIVPANDVTEAAARVIELFGPLDDDGDEDEPGTGDMMMAR